MTYFSTMFLKALKNNGFASYLFFAFLVLGFGFNVFSLPLEKNYFALSDLPRLCLYSDTLMRVLFLLVWLISVYWMAKVVTHYKLMEAKGGIILFLAAMLSFSFWSEHINLDVQIALLFLLFCIDQFFAIYQSQGKLYQSLNLGLLFGCAVYFYFPLIVLLPWLLMALGIVKSFQWRDVALPLIGGLIPFYIYSVYQFFTGDSNLLFTKRLLEFNPKVLSLFMEGITLKLYWLFALALLLLSLAYSFRIMDKLTVKIRMFYSILLWFTVFTIGLLFFTKGFHFESTFLLFPLVFLGANYLNTIKRQWIFDVGVLVYLFLLVSAHL